MPFDVENKFITDGMGHNVDVISLGGASANSKVLVKG